MHGNVRINNNLPTYFSFLLKDVLCQKYSPNTCATFSSASVKHRARGINNRVYSRNVDVCICVCVRIRMCVCCLITGGSFPAVRLSRRIKESEFDGGELPTIYRISARRRAGKNAAGIELYRYRLSSQAAR